MFTKGKWLIGSPKNHILNQSPTGTYRLIADCSPKECIDGTGNHTISEDEAQANAKLVSLAPEMLECLELLSNELRYTNYTLYQLQLIVDAVIKKAKKY